ncbi:MAG: SDR family oxidoreductase [Verrucomicrobia bacterium]|nr:SDR family oxidoreductase [Verrucomicrobiota bacterium]
MSQSTQIPSVLIFGATGGVGSALARRLGAAGWRLALSARGRERLASLCDELGAHMEAADASDSNAVENAFSAACEKFGRLDGVVNCAGSLLLKPAHLTTPEEWAQTLNANLTTAFHVLRAATSRMMRTGGGSIVLMASAVALRGMINHEAIAAAKAGVVGLAQSAAATYARYNIRVNCVAPSLIRTPLTASLTTNESTLRASVALHPLGRIGEPEEVASAIAWFLSPENSWVTGQVLAVDGGLSRLQPRTLSP